MRARLTLEGGECVPPTFELSPSGQPVTLGRSRDNAIVLRESGDKLVLEMAKLP